METGTGSTILVTGGSGFAGSQLARALAARRYHVRVLARVPEKAADLRSAGIDVWQGDLQDRQSVERACGGVRLIYNLAGRAREAEKNVREVRAVNAQAVGVLIEAAASAGVRRVVHCSTTRVHGRLGTLPAGEGAPLRPRDLVGTTKLEGERLAREAAARTGIELVVARPSRVYGPGDPGLSTLFRAIARRRFVLPGNGRSFVHLTYVDDLAEGLRLCGETSGAAGRTYVLAGAEATRADDLVRLIAREAGVRLWPVRAPVWLVYALGAIGESLPTSLRLKPPLGRRDLDIFSRNEAFDISRARAELGYAPRVDLREGVRRCLEWYRGQNWL